MSNQAKLNEISFSVGDTIKVYQEIKEAGKTRLQAFEGIVIAIKGSNEGKSFIVRRMATANIGVERIWPLISPHLKKIEVVKKGVVRRAKLYYLRNQKGKAVIKVKESKQNAEKKQRKTRRKSGRKISAKKRPKTS